MLKRIDGGVVGDGLRGGGRAGDRRRQGNLKSAVGDLEHRTVAACPALVCRAEEVPGGVGDQTGLRNSPVGAPGEGV